MIRGHAQSRMHIKTEYGEYQLELKGEGEIRIEIVNITHK